MRKLDPQESSSAVNRPFTLYKYLACSHTTLADVRDNLRLKRALRQAVLKDRAPQSLIDSIRVGIEA